MNASPSLPLRGPKKPDKKLPPIRMGDPSDVARNQKAQLADKSQADAKIRTGIYRDVLVLLDLADRLTMDLSSHEDRYGIEWNGLARQLHAQYLADVVKIVPAFQAKIMSKEGAQGLPKGLYRRLLDFADACLAFMKWPRDTDGGGATAADATPRQESEFMQASLRFKQACADMRQQICIFENERPAGEASFFG